ncbi:MAG: hypothetical protein QGD95_06295, partial [Actinomycetota bacterium]|nr:hypothetical protein [Actinomycetota bacterium]MDK1026891.1 hypothetical protein [Actinomycetota bacterium]
LIGYRQDAESFNSDFEERLPRGRLRAWTTRRQLWDYLAFAVFSNTRALAAILDQPGDPPTEIAA